MKDPRRLLEGDASELELHLLNVVQRERAPSDAPRRLAAQLGLPAGMVGMDTLGAAGQPGGSASGMPPAPIAASAGSGLLHGAAGKLLVVGVLGALGGGVLFGVMPSPGPATRTSLTSRSASRDGASSAPDRVPARAGDATRAGASAPAPAAARTSHLDGEVAALATVRAALQRGRAQQALADLSAFERQYPASVLTQEARALRVEALLAARETERARAEGERFLRSYPDSPHRARVQALLRAGRSLR